MPTVRITSPSIDPTYTNGPVPITAALDPPLDLPIILIENGNEIATLMPPAYSFEWNTAGVPEGTHRLVAQVAFSNEIAESPSKMIVVDRTRPTVTSRLPAPGATNVELRSTIRIEFSEPVVHSLPSGSTFSLSIGGTTVATSVDVDADTGAATISISDLSSVVLPATFAIAISSTIKDRAGNSLALPSSDWFWDVPDWFKAPVLLSASPPEMAVGGDGRPVLIRTDASSSVLLTSTYDGTAWVDQDPISSTISNGHFESYSVDVDAAGRPTIASVEANVGASVLKVRTWDGAAWQEPLPDLDWDGNPSATRSRFPVIRLTPDGNPVIAWREFLPGGGEDIFLARRSGSQWDKSLGGSGFTAVNGHALSLDRTGNPILGWSTPAGSGVSVWSGNSRTVSPMLPVTGQPSVGVDGSGRPLFLSMSTATFIVSALVQGTWQDVATVPSSLSADHPRLVAAPAGDFVVGWFDFSSQQARVGLSRWTGSNWDTRIGLFSNRGSVAVAPPSIAFDPRGSIWVGWREGTQVNVWKSNY
jgi:hypothetical protein